MRRSSLAQTALLSSFVATTLLASSASAQDGFQVDQFEPLPAQGTNLLNLSKSEVLGHLKPSFGLFVHGQDDPLQVVDEESGDVVGRIVDHQIKAELMAALGLFDWLDIGLAVPFVLAQSGEGSSSFGIDTISGFALGDIRITPKLRLLKNADFGGVGLAIAAPLYIPSGDQDSFNGDGGFRAEPRVAFDYASDFLTIVANVGVAVRPERVSQNHVNGTALRYGLGAEVPIVDPLSLIASWYGSVGLQDGRDPADLSAAADNAHARPMELLGGVQLDLPANLVAQAGAGAGLNSSIGSPDFRVFASLNYTPRGADSDGDGILDNDDDCPQDPEDKDRFEDGDGCPDTDNDSDGILDTADECPDDPEDMDNFEDTNGCPDPDNDQDGVLDVDDKCPDVAGDPTNEGCPLVDTDGDGLFDPQDECPNDPEDKDQFEDENGCPDPDNDSDGILDADDQCPLEKEVINGVKDEDGCPDEGKTKVRVTEKSIEILDKVYFDSNKATIKTRSHDVLNQVASILKANPQITKIRIEGHTDSRGKDAHNLDLSKRRAEAVRYYLTQRGLTGERLAAEGFGETKPIATNDTKAGREENRRVEFNIAEVNGKASSEQVIENK